MDELCYFMILFLRPFKLINAFIESNIPFSIAYLWYLSAPLKITLMALFTLINFGNNHVTYLSNLSIHVASVWTEAKMKCNAGESVKGQKQEKMKLEWDLLV